MGNRGKRKHKAAAGAAEQGRGASAVNRKGGSACIEAGIRGKAGELFAGKRKKP